MFIRDMVANETWCVTANASGTGSTSDSSGVREQQFSRDGSRFVFQTGLFENLGKLFMHDISARTNRLLADSVFWEGTRFGDSGRYALYCDGDFSLMGIDVETMRKQRIARLGGWSSTLPLSAVRLSGNGRWTFFVSNTNEVASVTDTNRSMDVFVVPTISPHIQSVSGTGRRTFDATAFPNDTVQLQRSGDLRTWETVASGQASDGGTITLQENAIGTSNAFYRLRSP
jgi:hypothetical protein